jgi:dolichyl-phosphate-mannose-protein mannosyltransferase
MKYVMVFFVSLMILTIGISADPSWKFDEVCYVGAARSFNAGTPSVNPEHPPLVKYLIALSIKAFGDSASGWRFLRAWLGR